MPIPREALALAVENPAENVVVVRVAGDLNKSTAPRLVRLLDCLIDRCARVAFTTDPRPTTDHHAHLVVDLAGVRQFGVGGLDVLRHPHHAAGSVGVKLHLSGLSSRAGLLPMWVAEQVISFDGFPTLEDAVAELSGDLPIPT